MVALTTGGKRDASITTRLSGGAGCGKVGRPSTRTNLPSCAETIEVGGVKRSPTRRARSARGARIDSLQP